MAGTPQSQQGTAPRVVGAQRAVDNDVEFVSYPDVLYVWPVVLAGLVGWLLADSIEPRLMGWCYLWIIVVVFGGYALDLSRNKLIFTVVVVVAIALAGAYLQDVKGITVLGDIYRWFAALDVGYNPGFGLALSIILGIPFVVLVLIAHFNDRWRFTYNEFEHRSFGRVSDSIGRGSKMVRIEYPDTIELLLALAGTIVIYDSEAQRELRRIPNVVLLPIRRHKLDRILEQQAVTTTVPGA